MQLVTLDFETYYDVGFSLSGLTTEEYIKDPRFQVIGVAIKIDDGVTRWVTGTHHAIKQELDQINWKETILLCHNTQFDGGILSFTFNIIPHIYLDTLSMARAIHGVDAGGSLAALVERYELGAKGTEVVDAKGKRLEDFAIDDLRRYGEYCINDVELTYKLWNVLSKDFPTNELKLIDLTLRMYTEPVLQVDDALLLERLSEVQAEKQHLLQGLMSKLQCQTEEEVRAKLASNKQFAEILQELGVIVPMKTSPATGNPTFALAKNDEGFIALTEHEDSFIQELCSVRLGTKSTIEESRIERFIGIGKRNKGMLPIPLKYYGAHTGRWAGSDKVNFQNLPSRDKKKKALKNAVVAPEGYRVINCDSSQIEARVLVWLAGQNDVVKWYEEGRDVYSEFASKVYDRPITKKDATERFVGKTCTLGLGYGTGWSKLQHTLKTSPPGAVLSDDECQRLVRVYRDVNNKVIDLWRESDEALRNMSVWKDNMKPYYLGNHEALLVAERGIRLPNGLYIQYPGLTWDTSEAKSKYIYKSRRGFISIWGGSVVENVVQALARIIVGEQMLKIHEKYRPALTVHDAVVCVVPEAEIDEAMRFIIDIMSTPPEWAKGLPVACEAHHGASYGDC
jgi:DNA polymerase I-like protein with 3'-5' exonuclease and polymerase domains